MANILEEIYHGNVHPQEKILKHEDDYTKIVKTISNSEERLNTFLSELPNSEKEQDLFSKLMNAQLDLANIQCCERFIEGLRFGAKFMLDTFIAKR